MEFPRVQDFILTIQQAVSENRVLSNALMTCAELSITHTLMSR